jgi:divalent metal cation (Fe/Co/Zn/Cd) transporter
MRTQHIGPDQLLVAAEMQMDSALDTAGVTAVIDRAEERIRKAVPIAAMIYLEPDSPATNR